MELRIRTHLGKIASGCAERANVVAGGGLVGTEAETAYNGQYVVNNVGLQMFIRHPLLAGSEKVYFYRQTLRSRLKLAHHTVERRNIAYRRYERCYIMLEIVTKYGHIRDTAGYVYRFSSNIL